MTLSYKEVKEQVNSVPATPKQLSLIEEICEVLGMDFNKYLPILNKPRATRFINHYYNDYMQILMDKIY